MPSFWIKEQIVPDGLGFRVKNGRGTHLLVINGLTTAIQKARGRIGLLASTICVALSRLLQLPAEANREL